MEKVNKSQNKVLDLLSQDEFKVKSKSKLIHSFSGNITMKGLKKMQNSPHIESINLIAKTYAAMDKSAPLINVKPDVWNLGYTGDGITVCVVDSGIDYHNPDLGGCLGTGCKVVGGHDYVNNDTNPDDDNGHGTNVAGIIASSDGVYKGIAYNVNLTAVKVLDNNKDGNTDDLKDGIEWCRLNAEKFGIKVITVSINVGTSRYNSACSDIWGVVDQINGAHDDGLLVSVASGNKGYTDGIQRPACAEGATSVGAVYDEDFGREPNSGYYDDIVAGFAHCYDSNAQENNITCFTNRGDNLDLLAPGYNITSPSPGSWAFGTSQATPHVAGAAALLFEKDPSLTPNQIENILKDTGVNVDSWKRIDVLAAINSSSNTSKTIEISNTGDSDLIVTSITDNKAWITSISPTSFTVNPGSSQYVSVTIDPSGYSPGTNSGTVSIYSNDPDESPKTVSVTMNIYCVDNDGDSFDDYDGTWCPGGQDCDDSDEDINPSEQEICDDGNDNDCDGDIDSADSDCASCNDIITQNTILTNDILNCNGYGLVIGADDITLDCNNHIVDGVNDWLTIGIYLNRTSGVTIKNCEISEFEVGIYQLRSNNSNLINNDVHDDLSGEIWVLLSSHNNIIGNTVSNNYYGLGILADYASYNNFTNNIANNNYAYGITLEGSYNILINNEVRGSQWGVYIDNSSTNTFVDNLFLNNTVSAHEVNEIAPSDWNVSTSGNYWSDFVNNSGYPNYYNVSGTGGGIDWHPSGSGEICNNNMDDDGDNYTDCADAECIEGSISSNGFCCGSGCSTDSGTCVKASISGFNCTDTNCNTYGEDCINGELESSLICSGTSLSCSGGSCEYNFSAPKWCDEITPSNTSCENSPGSNDELGCRVNGTDCYYIAEYFCGAPYTCDERSQNECSFDYGLLCEWQGTYNDNVIEECESSCGSISQCDEQLVGYNYANCTTGGESYFADQCSYSCQGEDRGDNICRSSAFTSGCTAHPDCNGIEAGTGVCDLNCDYDESPYINSLSITPNPQGFGENVTIEANITDVNGTSDIDIVLIGVTPPGELETNYTMYNISENLWQYKYTDYTNGTYSYNIYVSDLSGLNTSNSSTFDMYVHLYINIRTLKDNYTVNELVNITENDILKHWYQEDANGTSTLNMSNPLIGYLDVNYTKPNATLNRSIWEVKHGNPALHYNISLPDSCWIQDPLQLRIESVINISPINTSSRPYCNNGSNFLPIGNISSYASYTSNGQDNAHLRMYDGNWSTKAQMASEGSWCYSCGTSGHAIFEEAVWWNAYYSKSKLRNNASTNTSIYLLMKIQYWNGYKWLDEAIIQDDASPRKIEVGDQLDLYTVWNPNAWNTSTNSHGDGTYRAYFAVTDENDVILKNRDGIDIVASYNFSSLALPQDPHDSNKFIFQNSSGSNVAWFGDEGNIILKGICSNSTSCTAPSDSFIFKNFSNDEVGHVDPSGNLCIETGDCSDQSANCDSPVGGSFIIKDDSDVNKVYIDSTGDLCLVGNLVENGSP
ncbi:MAG: S8 family serine peptidase [Candidatus Woesearchaeota archaeon]